jgi:DNA-binding transcriptional LysR family regulator
MPRPLTTKWKPIMDTIETLRTFVRVVETGSLTAVARQMNASQSTVSRQIAQLEEHFGVRLLHRTTRQLSLTDDGIGLHDHARKVLEAVDGMEEVIGRDKASPTGHVRVATPVSLGLMLIGRLPALMERYPGLTIELVMQDRVGDMIDERLDLAVRIGAVENLSLITRGLGTATRIAVAAPDYVQRRGSPEHPDQLAAHDCIVHRLAPGDAEWLLTGPDGAISVAVHGGISTNNHEAVRGAALRGLGIALVPEYLAADDMRKGGLVRVMPEYSSETSPAYIVYPSRRHLAQRTRVVIDFMFQEVHRIRSTRADSGPSSTEGDPPHGDVVPFAA